MGSEVSITQAGYGRSRTLATEAQSPQRPLFFRNEPSVISVPPWLRTSRIRDRIARMKHLLAVLLLLATATGFAQPAPDVAALLKTVPDLTAKLARFKPVRMPFDAAALSERERQMVDQLVIACRELESMYWRQSDPEGLALYNALETVETPLGAEPPALPVHQRQPLRSGRREQPFVGTAPMPPGHALYPADLTRARDRGVRRQPSRQEGRDLQPVHGRPPAGARTSSAGRTTTSSRRSSTGAATALREAAALSDDPAFANVPAPARRRAV